MFVVVVVVAVRLEGPLPVGSSAVTDMNGDLYLHARDLFTAAFCSYSMNLQGLTEGRRGSFKPLNFSLSLPYKRSTIGGIQAKA